MKRSIVVGGSWSSGIFGGLKCRWARLTAKTGMAHILSLPRLLVVARRVSLASPPGRTAIAVAAVAVAADTAVDAVDAVVDGVAVAHHPPPSPPAPPYPPSPHNSTHSTSVSAGHSGPSPHVRHRAQTPSPGPPSQRRRVSRPDGGGGLGEDEELGTVGMGSGIGHTEQTGFGMGQGESFVFKRGPFSTVHRIGPGSVLVHNVSPLYHKVFHHTMERNVHVFLVGTQLREIVCGSWSVFGEQADDETADKRGFQEILFGNVQEHEERDRGRSGVGRRGRRANGGGRSIGGIGGFVFSGRGFESDTARWRYGRGRRG